MDTIKIRVKTSFGEIEVEGENPQEVIDSLKAFPEDFIEQVSVLVTSRLVPRQHQLTGIVEFTTEGPVIITQKKLTHYEAIGLILYASQGKRFTTAQITNLLEQSGLKCMVPARLYEMTKKGRVFKPDPPRPYYKLTVQGERWIEEETLPKLTAKRK